MNHSLQQISQEKELTGRDFFFCYDKKMSAYLSENGESYIMKARSVTNGNLFTLYYRNEKLGQLLSEYSNIKKVV